MGSFQMTPILLRKSKVMWITISTFFRTLRDALGLYVKEQRVNAIYISDQVQSEEVQSQDWDWKIESTFSKLLGDFMGSEISPHRMLKISAYTLKKCLEKARKNPYLLVVRVQIVNQLVSRKT